ncbi:hypothetical protein [Microcoleus sp. D3_18a_C4]|uniref:hypothetical protein n=1 Tax=Microcoleus sp. D3_18a_C4 TaxID=3055332 RepID=UPI002FD5765F
MKCLISKVGCVISGVRNLEKYCDRSSLTSPTNEAIALILPVIQLTQGTRSLSKNEIVCVWIDNPWY